MYRIRDRTITSRIGASPKWLLGARGGPFALSLSLSVRNDVGRRLYGKGRRDARTDMSGWWCWRNRSGQK